MTWEHTVPYPFYGANVVGYAEDTTGAFVIERDRSWSPRPFVLYRYYNNNDRGGYQIVGFYASASSARRRAGAMEVTA